MTKSYEQDIQKLNSIVKSITNIKVAFEKFSINDVSNFQNNELVQLCCTQILTNIYQDKKALDENIYNKLTELNKIELGKPRNIASHDYNSLDFSIIYGICKRLVKSIVLSEIYAVLAEIEEVSDD